MKHFRPPTLFNVFVLFACLSLFIGLKSFAMDPGVGWHLATGKWILNNLSVPKIDPFLFAESGKWVADQWLADLLLYSMYLSGGWALIFAYLSIFFLLLFTVILWPFLFRLTGSALLSVLAALYAFKLAQVHFVLRPVMLGFFPFIVYFLVTTVILKQLKESRTQQWRLFYLILSVVTIFWANIHPSFFLGFIVIGWGIISSILQRTNFETLKKFALAIILCVLASFINPNGIALHQTVLFLSSSKFAMSYYQEWQPPNLTSVEGVYFLIGFSFLAIMLLASAKFRQRAGIFHVGLILIFGCWGFQSLRMLPYFGVIASLPIVYAGQILALSFSKYFPLSVKQAFYNLERKERQSHTYQVVLFGCIAIFSISLSGLLGEDLKLRMKPSVDDYPYRAVAFLKSKAALKKEINVLNEMSWGGFISWEGDGKLRAFIDDRTALFGDAFYKDYFEHYDQPATLLEFARLKGANYMLFSRREGPGKFIEQEYKDMIVFKDDLSIVTKIDPQQS